MSENHTRPTRRHLPAEVKWQALQGRRQALVPVSQVCEKYGVGPNQLYQWEKTAERDELLLSAEERAPIVNRLFDCIRAGLPILNSRAGLLALKSGDWPRRPPSQRAVASQALLVHIRASHAQGQRTLGSLATPGENVLMSSVWNVP